MEDALVVSRALAVLSARVVPDFDSGVFVGVRTFWPGVDRRPRRGVSFSPRDDRDVDSPARDDWDVDSVVAGGGVVRSSRPGGDR